MCGIFACHRHPSGTEIKTTALKMSKAIRHRGPDWSGITVVNKTVLAHERLSIVGVETGHQPMASPDGSCVLIANGEIYNHHALRQRLGSCYPFQTQSDSEVVIASFLEHGLEAPKILDGIFAFVLYSTSEDRVVAARDPIGVVSLYQGWSKSLPDTVFFASELKSLYPVCDKIIQFPPGHVYDSLTQVTKRYFQPAWIDYERIPYAPVNYRRIRTLLESAVRQQMMTEVPFGVLLSGGLDSSLIASIASREVKRLAALRQGKHKSGRCLHLPKSSALQSFSIGLPRAPDLEAARDVARAIGTEHHSFTFTVQEGIDALSDVILHLETFDVTTVRASTPMFLLCRKIKSLGIKMVLSGEGSDEMFGGYLYFHAAPDKAAFHRETIRRLQNLHLADCLRANKSSAAWGVEARVPFLDQHFLAEVMDIDPAEKMITADRMEKYILRKAFDNIDEPGLEPYLPEHVLWRQKEQFSDGVGYSWIDGLKDAAEKVVTDEMMSNIPFHWQEDPPATKEAYWYRRIFDEHFPAYCASTVMRWTPTWSRGTDPSGRAISTHFRTYSTGDWDQLVQMMSPTTAKRIPYLFAEALLSKDIFNGILEDPFFTLEVLGEVTFPTAPQLSSLYQAMAEIDGVEAHVWRSQTLRILQTPDRVSKSDIMFRGRLESNLSRMGNHRSEQFLSGPARYLLRTPSGNGQSVRKVLADIYTYAGQLALSLWTQRSYLKCLELQQIPRFSIGQELMRAHAVNHLDEEDTHLDGQPIIAIIQPALLAFGNDNAEYYEQHKVWAEAIVLIDERT